MSSAILQGGASGTGSMTLLAPNTNSNQIITMPDVTGTLLTNKTSGTILQVVTVQINTRYQTTASSFTGIGPTLSITPSSTNSRIFLLSTFSIQFPAYTYMTFLRNGTNVSGAAQGIITYGASSIWLNDTMMYVDSPSTTSAITYQLGMYVNSGTVSLNDYSAGNNNQLIAMEIA